MLLARIIINGLHVCTSKYLTLVQPNRYRNTTMVQELYGGEYRGGHFRAYGAYSGHIPKVRTFIMGVSSCTPLPTGLYSSLPRSVIQTSGPLVNRIEIKGCPMEESCRSHADKLGWHYGDVGSWIEEGIM